MSYKTCIPHIPFYSRQLSHISDNSCLISLWHLERIDVIIVKISNKMKTFKLIRNHLESVGPTASQSIQTNPLNVKNVIILSIFGLNILLTVAFIAFTADDFEEYVDSMFGCSTVIILFGAFGFLIWQWPTLFRFIVKLENVINKSESNIKPILSDSLTFSSEKNCVF